MQRDFGTPVPKQSAPGYRYTTTPAHESQVNGKFVSPMPSSAMARSSSGSASARAARRRWRRCRRSSSSNAAWMARLRLG